MSDSLELNHETDQEAGQIRFQLGKEKAMAEITEPKPGIDQDEWTGFAA